MNCTKYQCPFLNFNNPKNQKERIDFRYNCESLSCSFFGRLLSHLKPEEYEKCQKYLMGKKENNE